MGEGVEEMWAAQDFLFRMRNSSNSSPLHFLYREMVLGETRVRTPNKDGHGSGLHIQMVTGQGQRAVHMVRDSISGVRGSQTLRRMVSGQRLHIGSGDRPSMKKNQESGSSYKIVTGQGLKIEWSGVRTPYTDGHGSGLHIQMATGQGLLLRCHGSQTPRVHIGWSRVRDSIKDGHGSGLHIQMVTGQDSIYK